jgi:hypothetical protein
MMRLLDRLQFWMLLLVLGVVALFLLIMGSLLLAILVACCWEKQRVRDFTPAGPELLPPPSPYFKAMSDAARELGFQPGGVFGQNRKSATYRCCLGLWLSPDQRSLLCIGGGKLARMNYKKTFLVSRLSGEKSLVTMDAFGSEDLSGTREVEVLMNADLRELNQLHLQRLAGAHVQPRAFAADNLLGQFEEWNRLRADRLVAQGLARYLSPERNTWRFTLKGGWRYGMAAFFTGLTKALAQEARKKIKRPGD